MQLSRTALRRASTESVSKLVVRGRVIPSVNRFDLGSGLVNSGWLGRNLSRSDVKILDCSWSPSKDHKPLYPKVRIPGAKFFDINECCDKSTDLPHMLPSASEFNSYCSHLGLRSHDTVIIYDDTGLTAPRLWWTFRALATTTSVAVLDGGLLKWQSEKRSLETGTPRPAPSTQFVGVDCRQNFVVSIAEVKKRIEAAQSKDIQFSAVDARSNGRFRGVEPEPRPIPSGHFPFACNVPFTQLLGGESYKEFQSPPEILKQFESAGVDFGLGENLVCSCGSGCTACTLALGLHLLGLRNPGEVKVYDGSWSEWALDPVHNPIVTEKA